MLGEGQHEGGQSFGVKMFDPLSPLCRHGLGGQRGTPDPYMSTCFAVTPSVKGIQPRLAEFGLGWGHHDIVIQVVK